MSYAAKLKVQDRYNPSKDWLVKRSKWGHWFLSQAVNGVRLYPYQRCKRYAIEERSMLTSDELKGAIMFSTQTQREISIFRNT